jgi:hypothetical protein
MENADWRTNEDLANDFMANFVASRRVPPDRQGPSSSLSGILPFTGQAYKMRPDGVPTPEKTLREDVVLDREKRARRAGQAYKRRSDGVPFSELPLRPDVVPVAEKSARRDNRSETDGKRMRATKRGDTLCSGSDDAVKEQTNAGDTVSSDSDEEGKAKKQDEENMKSALAQSRIAVEERRLEQEEFDIVMRLSLSNF